MCFYWTGLCYILSPEQGPGWLWAEFCTSPMELDRVSRQAHQAENGEALDSQRIIMVMPEKEGMDVR